MRLAPDAPRLAGWILGLAVSGIALRSPGEELLPDLKIPFWYKTVDLRGSLGYKDNVTLSSSAAKGSAFWDSGLDLMVYRLPSHGWQITLFGTGDDVRYFKRVGVNDEQTAIGALQVTKDLGKGWKAGLGGLATYQNQVFDVSATEATNVIAKVVGHGFGARAMLHKDLNSNWAELELTLTRQYFAQPLDDYWQEAPRLTLGHTFRPGSELSASFQFAEVQYDTRPQLTVHGAAIPDTHLRFRPEVIETAFQHSFDKERRWRVTTKLGLEINHDNGSGFFDYYLYRASQKAGYYGKSWAVEAQVRGGFYDFSIQAVSAVDPEKRNKTLWGVNLRAEKNLFKNLKAFATYSHEDSNSNLPTDNYQGNTISGGIDWQF